MSRTWSSPQRPAEHAERSLVTAILDGTFPPRSKLPAERELAVQIGVTRPTLREAIQRLGRDGWITVRQGKQTTVNDYWRQGGLNLLDSLVRHSEYLPPSFIADLLDVRRHLAPGYFRTASERSPDALLELLDGRGELLETPQAFAEFDWRLHHGASVASGNPIYTLILNGFVTSYEQLAALYFATAANRLRSARFYADLEGAVRGGDVAVVERIVLEMMTESIDRWEDTIGSSPETVTTPVRGGA
ncbi:MAG: fatty acid metabolism transcriptional regulator FadR [Actinobacteria bacterium]|nr:fatty acid metabolism transcriptional regulator FadR [Actinomycetota bacterium]